MPLADSLWQRQQQQAPAPDDEESASLLPGTATRQNGAAVRQTAAASRQNAAATDIKPGLPSLLASCPGRPSFKVAALVLLVVLSCVAAWGLRPSNMHKMFTLLEEHPEGGAALLWVAFTCGIVLLVPGMALSAGVGAVYGFAVGSALAWSATVVGQTAAFCVGRYLLRDLVVDVLVARVPNFSAIEGSIQKEGWKLVLLLRLSPLLPFNLLNYALSVTAIDVLSFAVPSAIAVTPWVLLFCWLGAVSNDLLDALSGGHATATWLVVGAGLFVVGMVGVVRIVRQAVVHAQQQIAQQEGSNALQLTAL